MEFWSDFKRSFLKKSGNSKICESWLSGVKEARLKKTGGASAFTLRASSDLHKKWLQDHVLPDLSSALRQRVGPSCHVKIEVVPRLPARPGRPLFSAEPPAGRPPAAAGPRPAAFHPGYVFESFVVGKHNEFAHGACFSIARLGGRNVSFNPLFIHGPSGLGKTHLLNAAGQEILRRRPAARIFYLSAERFLNECVLALQKREMPEFQKKYRRQCDALLMDDIQMIARGARVQEEFFHTFNDLHERGVQVIVCCDRPPGRVPHLEARIKSRLEGGLVADISYPDRETRLAILGKKAEAKGLFLSGEARGRIADAFKFSIRGMEGLLNKIKMLTDLHGGKLSQAQMRAILRDSAAAPLTAEEISSRAAEKFHVSLEDLKSPCRKRPIVIARQTAMYFIKSILRKSLSETGAAFGKKDHTTALNAIKKVNRLKEADPDFRKAFEELKEEFAGARAP